MRNQCSRVPVLALALALFLSMGLSGFGQSDNGQIAGFVKDPSGAVVPGVTVVVKNETRSFERTAVSNEQGYYVIANLPPGLYTITAELTGFKKFQVTGKKLDPNMTATLDVTLAVGEMSETVSVTAAGAAVQSESSTVGKLVELKSIELLQLNGRNPLFLAQTKAGIIGGSIGGNSFGLTTGGLNINGGRTQDNLITLGGAVGVRTRSNGTSIGVADLDATQEVQILSTNYQAEYGRSASGQIRIVTKSGGPKIHGIAYEYLRNSALNSNSWNRNQLDPSNLTPCDSNPKVDHCRPSPFRYNQFGYNVNGPVWLPFYNKDRKKLFWLFGEEWVRRRAADTTITTVPSLAMKRGDFSELLSASNRFYGGVRVINDPLTGQPFPGNIIPTSRLSANGTGLLKAYPDPTPGFIGPGTANFTQTRPVQTDQRKDTVSIDWYPSDKHQVRWRAQFYNFVDVSAFRAGTDRAPQIIDRPNQTTSVNWVWTMSPTMTGEMLLTGSRDQVYIAVDTRTGTHRRSNYGITYPYIFPDRKEIFDKIPTVNFTSVITDLDGGPYPSQSVGPIYDASYSITKIKGKHTLKAGFMFERAGENDFDQINVSGVPGGTNNQNGRFEFRNTRSGGTGLDLADAALGLFSSYAEIGVRSFTPYRGHMYEWFVQDSWKVNEKLRLELGLRHSIIQPYYSLWRNMVVFDIPSYNTSIAAQQDPATGFITTTDLKSLYNGLVFPGDTWPDSAKGRVPVADTGQFNFMFRGLPKQYSEVHKNNFQPRFGFAYRVGEKTVVRSGVGRFFTRLGVSDSVFLGGNPPLQPMVSIANGNVDNPGGTSGRAFTQNITTQDPVFKNPEAWAWNLTVEREIGFDTTIEASYVGRRGLHAQRERNINQLATGTCPNGSCNFVNGVSGTRFNPDYLRPYHGFNTIRVTNNDANSLYNAFQLGLTRRFTKGFAFSLAYTLSKLEDDGSAQRDIVPNAYDVHNLWGPATYDRRHVVVINAIYELPFLRNRSNFVGKTLGGWSISALSQFQTGNPLTIATSDDFAGVGPGSGSQFWTITGDPNIGNGEKKFSINNNDANYWFNKAVFTRPAAGTFSSQYARGVAEFGGLYGPGFQNHNLGIFKQFKVNETQSLWFRFEAFNWLNHPNWQNPTTNPTSGSFGRVQGKDSAREIQFALRYAF
jgi:hypothetical protein